MVAMDVLAGTTRTVNLLEEFGAKRSFVIGTSRGVGRIPTDEQAEVALLDVRATSLMAGIRKAEHALNNLSAETIARVDAWDPDHTAQVISTIFSGGKPIAGRRILGARPLSWQALEDKTVIDALWDAAGVARAPYRVVRIADLAQAAPELDQGLGTVWAGDSRAGFHGAATYLRWVRTPEDAIAAAAFLADDCDTARIMPFMEGIPCSIHGIVFPDYVVALRPCEMLVLRRPGDSRLTYAKAATFWDPQDVDASQMRAIARRVGEHLRASVGYRGAFTLDGIMTVDGFRPTELNPRFGAALGVLTKGIPNLPLNLLNQLIVEGHDLDFRPQALEQLILGHANIRRFGVASAMSTTGVTETLEVDGVFEGDVWREAHSGEERDGQFILGPSAMGSYLMVVLEPDRTPVGPSVAPRSAAALAFADERWSLGLGPLEPAKEVRGR